MRGLGCLSERRKSGSLEDEERVEAWMNTQLCKCMVFKVRNGF